MEVFTVVLIILLIAAGSWLLGNGADWLTDGASGLAHQWGIQPLIVGLTVVAFGTSLPELAASLMGGPVIAAGNALGSNMINIGLVLGITALIRPIPCARKFIKFEVTLMVIIGPLVWLLAIIGGGLSWFDGLILTTCLVAFTWNSFIRGKRHEFPEMEAELTEVPDSAKLGTKRLVLLTICGLIGVTVGAKYLVEGATLGARLLGVSERVIALTVIAAGTSLPELATCVAAALKNQGAMALGNLIGSNIFNLLAILGITSLVFPIPMGRESILIDFPAVVLLQALCIPLLSWRKKVGRSEGLILLMLYGLYCIVIFNIGRH